MSTKWIPTSEAAKESGYNAEHLRRLVRNGEIKAQKFGSVWQIDRVSLFQYLEQAGNKRDKRWGPRSN
jgi:excisionase family DNA binding protein